MARLYRPNDLDAALNELESQSPRAAIIVGGSFIEYALEQAITSRLREASTKTEIKALFNEREGIYGTFSQKIWAAYFLKIIGPSVRHDLDLIRKIRNHAAHNLEDISFEDTTEIANRCRQLMMAKDAAADGVDPSGLRARFLLTVRFFAANLLLRASDHIAEIAEASKDLAPSLDR